MKIIDNRTTIPQKSFNKLNSGEVFEYGGIVHMKTNKIEDDSGIIVCNAVALSSGTLKCFDHNDLVNILDYKFTIE